MKKAFTLIELLVAITIISLLASIILASLSNAKHEAKVATAKSQLAQIKNVAVMHLVDRGTFGGPFKYTCSNMDFGNYNTESGRNYFFGTTNSNKYQRLLEPLLQVSNSQYTVTTEDGQNYYTEPEFGDESYWSGEPYASTTTLYCGALDDDFVIGLLVDPTEGQSTTGLCMSSLEGYQIVEFDSDPNDNMFDGGVWDDMYDNFICP